MDVTELLSKTREKNCKLLTFYDIFNNFVIVGWKANKLLCLPEVLHLRSTRGQCPVSDYNHSENKVL